MQYPLCTTQIFDILNAGIEKMEKKEIRAEARVKQLEQDRLRKEKEKKEVDEYKKLTKFAYAKPRNYKGRKTDVHILPQYPLQRGNFITITLSRAMLFQMIVQDISHVFTLLD